MSDPNLTPFHPHPPGTHSGTHRRKLQDKSSVVMRVVLMLVLLATLGAGFFWLRSIQLGTGPDPGNIVDVPRENRPGAERVPFSPGDPKAPAADTGAPTVPRVPTSTLSPEMLAEIRDATPADRLIREPGPYQHLLTEARKLSRGDLEALGMQPIDAKAVLAAPALHRGKAFSVRGVLETADVSPDSEFDETRGTIRDADGQRYAFSVLQEPDVEVGDGVRLEGFFFKLVAKEKAPGEFIDDVIYLVGRRLVKSRLNLPPGADLAAIPFHEARDGDLKAMVDWPEDLVHQALHFIQSVDPAHLASLPVEEVDWSTLRKEPDRFRGKLVRIVANCYPALQWERRMVDDAENPLGQEVLHEGLLKRPHDQLFRWIGLQPVPRESITDSRLVVMEGIFIKNLLWQNTRSDPVSGPLIVTTRVMPFAVPESSGVAQVVWFIVGLTALCVLLVVFGVFSDRQKARDFQKAYLRRKRTPLAGAGDVGRASASEPPARAADDSGGDPR